MDTQKYRVLLKAIENGNLSKTAQEMGYTQSGVTHMIHSIESEWKITLLVRAYNGVSITPEGERLLPHIREICNAENRLHDEINAMHGLQTGLIRIGTFTSVSTHLLPEVIQRFGKKYPGIEFEIRLGDYLEIEEWLLEGSVDVGFLKTPVHPKLTSIPIIKDRLLAVLPPEHSLAATQYIDPTRLSKEPFILLDVGKENEFEAFFDNADITPNVRYRVKDDYTVMSMVERGLGVSLLHELVLQRNPYRVEIRDFVEPLYREITISYEPKSERSLVVRRFLDHLKTILEDIFIPKNAAIPPDRNTGCTSTPSISSFYQQDLDAGSHKRDEG